MASASAGGALRNRAMSKLAAIRTGSIMRVARRSVSLSDVSPEIVSRACRALTRSLSRAGDHELYRPLRRHALAVQLAELAEREGIAPSFLSRSLRMTLLAPNIVEAILDGRQPADLTLETLREPAPAQWQEQMSWLHRNRKVS